MSAIFKIAFFLAVAALCVKLALTFLNNKKIHSQSSNAAQSQSARNPYQGLRDQALHLKREKIALATPSKPTEPWAAIMDWGVDNGTATVVAIADGTASIYLSSGSGSIGGGQSHEFIRAASRKMVLAAAEVQPQMRQAEAFPLPQRGQVTFYAVTDAGVFTASASQDELSARRSPFSKFGDAAQEIITQYRMIENSK